MITPEAKKQPSARNSVRVVNMPVTVQRVAGWSEPNEVTPSQFISFVSAFLAWSGKRVEAVMYMAWV